jgi:Ca2+-binding RTX toxin-like protein
MPDVEKLIATEDADVLVGSAADNEFDGDLGGDEISGGDGFDTASYATRPGAVTADLAGDGGDGYPGENDTIGSDIEALIGGFASDTLTGNSGQNYLDGGPGDDVANGALGADEIVGGSGSGDVVSYASHAQSVHVDLDAEIGDDGQAGEGDTVRTDIEGILGGSGSDVLEGSAAVNKLDGGPGSDTMNGLGAQDWVDYSSRSNGVVVDLDGEVGDDGEAGEGDSVGEDIENIAGGAGDDVLVGSSSGNELLGGTGADDLSGGDDSDRLRGGPGDDWLEGGLGGDHLQGDAGLDMVDYSSRIEPVHVDLDGQSADDGEVGEGDTVLVDV